MKISLTLNCPIEFKRIRDGEKVIVDKGLAEPIIELLEGDIEGESPLQQVNKLLDEYERELRRARAQRWKTKITQSRRSQTTGVNQ